ncbi:metallophosphoesterase [Pseudoroseomonas wenyumeiae]
MDLPPLPESLPPVIFSLPLAAAIPTSGCWPRCPARTARRIPPGPADLTPRDVRRGGDLLSCAACPPLPVAGGAGPPAPGLRVYAIGDVHGRDDLLRRLHASIAADWAAAPAARAAVVHLGDYVDRGPDSPGVLRRIAGPPPVPGAESVTLRGNHEALMLDALAPGAPAEAQFLWQLNGGRATLAAYRGHVPERDREILRGLALSWRAGDYLFVHAGIDPRKPLEAQTETDLVWTREPFVLAGATGHGGGAWPYASAAAGGAAAPDRHRHGRRRGGALTCLVLEGDGLRFLSAS